MSYFDLKIVTPTKSIDFEFINYVRCPGLEGLFGIMSNHQKGIFALDIGEIKVDNKNSSSFYSTSGGYAEFKDNKLLLLLETVESKSEIDKIRAEAALKRANERLKSNEGDETRAKASLIRAQNRLKIISR